MSESKHTPGPWFVNESEHKYDQDRNWRRIVTVKNKPGKIEIVPVIKWEFKDDRDGVYGGNAITKADAYLIAAAPDLLDSLEVARDFIQQGIELGFISTGCAGAELNMDSIDEMLDKFEEALQKARRREDE